MAFRRVAIKERTELQPLLLEQIESVEPGLRVLDSEVGLKSAGRPDILARDQSGGVVILELKDETSSVLHVDQGLRYFEWVQNNIAWLARIYPGVDPKRSPRILLVAPEFGDDAVRLAKYLDLELELLEYIAIEEDGSRKRGLIVTPLSIDRPKGEGAALQSLEDIIAYCQSEELRGEVRRVISHFQALGCVVSPHKGGKYRWVQFTFANEPAFYLQTMKKWFYFQCYDWARETWIKPVKLNTLQELSSAFDSAIRTEVESSKSG